MFIEEIQIFIRVVYKSINVLFKILTKLML